LDVQESPNHQRVRLIIRCDTPATSKDDDDDDDDDDEGDGDYDKGNAAVDSDDGSSSDEAAASTVNLVETGDITVRPSTRPRHTDPCQEVHGVVSDAPDHRRTSRKDHGDARSAVPSSSRGGNQESSQRTDDVATTEPPDKELDRTQELHRTTPSYRDPVALSDISRVLRELNTKLEQITGTDLREGDLRASENEVVANAAEEQAEHRVGDSMISDAGNTSVSSGDSQIDPRCVRGGQIHCRRTASVIDKPSETDQHPKSPGSVDPLHLKSIPSLPQLETVPEWVKNADLQEPVRLNTLKTSKDEERVNQLLEYDLLTMTGTGKEQSKDDPDQDRTETRLAVTVGSPNTCGLRSDQERTGPPWMFTKDDRTSDKGMLTETETD